MHLVAGTFKTKLGWTKEEHWRLNCKIAYAKTVECLEYLALVTE